VVADPFRSPAGTNASDFSRKGWTGESKRIANFRGRAQGTKKRDTAGEVRQSSPPGKVQVAHARQTPAGDFKADDPSGIQVGMKVEHIRFGSGKVLNLEGPEANRKATVFFQEHGQKQLLLKFARLKIIR